MVWWFQGHTCSNCDKAGLHRDTDVESDMRGVSSRKKGSFFFFKDKMGKGLNQLLRVEEKWNLGITHFKTNLYNVYYISIIHVYYIHKPS